MDQADPFGRWLDQFASLADVEVFDLPDWQQPLAFIHQFALFAASDGAGSLFYNHTDNIENVAEAFEDIDELELAARIQAVFAILEPFAGDGPLSESDEVLEACLNGAATEDIRLLDEQFQRRWQAVYAKLEAIARANGWTA